MVGDAVLASMWAFCGGINFAKALSTGHWSDWVIMSLDLLCAGAWIAAGYIKHRCK